MPASELVALAEKRGSDDNISLQLIEVRDWEQGRADGAGPDGPSVTARGRPRPQAACPSPPARAS